MLFGVGYGSLFVAGPFVHEPEVFVERFVVRSKEAGGKAEDKP